MALEIGFDDVPNRVTTPLTPGGIPPTREGSPSAVTWIF
jgi:hypothetical protein